MEVRNNLFYKIVITLLLLVGINPTYGQIIDPHIWSQAVGLGDLNVSDLTTDEGNNVLISGYFEKTLTYTVNGVEEMFGETNGRNYNIGFLAKINPNGEALWYHIAEHDFEVNSDIKFVKTNYLGDIFTLVWRNAGYELFKFNSNGDLLWTYFLGASDGNIQYKGMEVTKDQLILFKESNYNSVFEKLSFDGEFLGTRGLIINSYSSQESPQSFTIDSNENIYASTDKDGQASVLKFDSEGSLLWRKVIVRPEPYSNQSTTFFKLKVSKKGNIFLGGTYFYLMVNADSILDSDGQRDLFVAKMNSNGEFIWVNSIGSKSNPEYNNVFHDIHIDENENCYFSGIFADTVDFDFSSSIYNASGSRSSSASFVLKIDSLSHFQWVRTYQLGNYVRKLDTDKNNNLIVAIEGSNIVVDSLDSLSYIKNKNLSRSQVTLQKFGKIDNALSIFNSEDINAKHFYPVPSKDWLMIDESKRIEILGIYSSNGILSNFDLSGSQINLENFEPGIFFIKYLYKDSIFVQKIIKE